MFHSKFLKYIALLVMFCALSLSALTVNQSVTVDINGGGQVIYTYNTSLDSVWLCREFQKRLGLLDFTDKAAVLQHFQAFPGVKVESYFTVSRGEVSRTQIVVSAKDLPAAMKAGAFGGLTIAASPKITGDLELTASMPQGGKPRPELDPLLKQLGDLELTLLLTTPTEIIESTGEKVAFNRHRWKLDGAAIIRGKFPTIHARW